MIAYASYLPKNANIARNAVVAACLDGGFMLLAGAVVFAVLGFMAHQQDTFLSEVVQESIGLAFVAYPPALNVMPGGALFGVVFFLCLVLAVLSIGWGWIVLTLLAGFLVARRPWRIALTANYQE